MTDSFKNTVAWLLIGTIGVFMAMNAVSASFLSGEYLPVGNDSFYHARRILDTVHDPSAFFEFDDRIHVPEGSWITWPWLFDYMMAMLVSGIAKLTGSTNPVPILMYLPVFWLYLNVGLMMLVARELGLGLLYRSLAGLGVALSPLTQILHGTGSIDHHFAEFTFILLTLLGGLRWFGRPDLPARGVFLGFVLGIACGFHNGLFILQLPVLAAFAVLWARGFELSPRSVIGLAAGLLGGVILVLIPSIPFQKGFFEYYYLSWFHLYVATCTVAVMALMARLRFRAATAMLVGIVAVLLSLPLFGNVLSMEAFLSKDISRFDVIVETRTPLSTFIGSPKSWLVNFYSLLAVLTPLTWLASLWLLIRSPTPRMVFAGTMSVFGLSLFFLQVRLHYYGSFAMILGPLVFAGMLERSGRFDGRKVAATVIVLWALVWYPPVKNRLFAPLPLGMDAQYGLVQQAIPFLAKACAEDPGVVLAYNDLGNYIRYHTDCSVIANNFLLTSQHEQKIAELDSLFNMDLDELLRTRPDIRYLFVGFPYLVINRDDGTSVLASREDLPVINGRWPLMSKLLLDDSYGSDKLTLLFQKRIQVEDDEFAVVRLYKVKSPGDTAEGADLQSTRRE